MSAVLELEYLKGPTDHAGVRAKKRRTTRSERRQVKMTLAGAIVANTTIHPPKPPIYYDETLDVFFQYNQKVGDFVEVPMWTNEGEVVGLGSRASIHPTKNVVFLAHQRFSNFTHPRYDNKGGDTVNNSCRMNTVCRWLRSMAGKPWNEVQTELIARFKGKGEFLWSQNVHQFCRKVESGAFPEFFVDESGTFRCRRKTKFHNPDAPNKPAPKRKNLAERLATKEDNELKIKKIFREKRFMTSNRKKKRQGWKSELRAA